jgi:hypothetical protein
MRVLGTMRVLRRIAPLLCALPLALALVALVAPGEASAHERRDLLGGKYQAVVGWLNEPAYQGQMNALSLVVTSKTEKTAAGADKPIEGLEQTLKAQVIVGGGRSLDLQLQARFGLAGNYAGYVEPTRAGQYTFRIYGTINGEQIDERFESGPGRFADIVSREPLQFPDPVSATPSDLQAQLDELRSAANTGRLIGIVGVVVGLLGLGAAALALLRRPATRATRAGD